MSEHFTDAIVNSLADGELTAEQMTATNAHLAGCPTCTTRALERMMLKSATARAGQRYALPDDVRDYLLRRVSTQIATPTNIAAKGWGWLGWAVAAAVLLVAVSLGVLQRTTAARTDVAALVTEVCDLHVAVMAANAPPEVLSSDRHTVKPWFQGKIPFSFNLPEGLPSDTKLNGANLSYVRHRPVAQLLYSIGQHRVSVFVQEHSGAEEDVAAERSGFHIVVFSTPELEMVAVSDVDPARLAGLATAIRTAQSQGR
jgi:anti-sigma factor RsiW